MPKTIRIPEVVLRGLEKVILLPEGSVEILLGLLSSIDVSKSAAEIKKVLCSNLNSVTAEDADAIFEATISMFAGREQMNTSFEGLAESVAERFVATKKTDDAGLSRLKAFLNGLKALEPGIGAITKAMTVGVDHDKVFCESRILSDVRPIFGDVEDKPVAALVYHSLKVRYHHANDTKTIQFALDDEDLARLKTVVDRALAKSRSLKQFIRDSGTPCLEHYDD